MPALVRMAHQQQLFAVELPEGFVYRSDFITPAEERELICTLESLDFQPFEFQGYIAKRRVIEYGYEYDFSSRRASSAPPIPEFLYWLRDRCADLAVVEHEELVECVIHEYPPGAPMGWHRDVPQFEIIVGVSLASACRMRLKPYRAEGKPIGIVLEPRSAYIMRGDARWKYQHSIPAVEKLRYSITFRTLRKKSLDRVA
jgi:alkylated DNA repair dioxygenase AlkB